MRVSMRSIVIGVGGALILMLSGCTLDTSGTRPACSTMIGDHFYTTNRVERDTAINVDKYEDDGYCSIYGGESPGCVSIAGYIFKKKDLFDLSADAVPLYRLYRPLDNGDHFYTTNIEERGKALNENKYKDDEYCRIYEGGNPGCVSIAGYIFPTQKTGTVPLFRLYKSDKHCPYNGDHFYTTSRVERDKAINVDKYEDDEYCRIYEGGSPGCISIAGYIYPTRRTGTVPLFRLYHP